MGYEHGLGRLRLILPTFVLLQQKLETLPDQAHARRGLTFQAFFSVNRAGTVHVSGAVSHQPRSGQRNLPKEPSSGQAITLDHELYEVQGRIKPSTSELQCPAYKSSVSRRHNHDGRWVQYVTIKHRRKRSISSTGNLYGKTHSCRVRNVIHTHRAPGSTSPNSCESGGLSSGEEERVATRGFELAPR